MISFTKASNYYYNNLHLHLKRRKLFCFTDPELYIPRPTNWDRFLGHDIRWKKGGPETIGYSDVGVFRDVLLVPPLANITVRGFCSDTDTRRL